VVENVAASTQNKALSEKAGRFSAVIITSNTIASASLKTQKLKIKNDRYSDQGRSFLTHQKSVGFHASTQTTIGTIAAS